MTPFERLLHWVTAREAIRIRKDRGDPRPWTDDPILAEWRFCNVRREDDRVTRWIAENVRARYADDPILWFMLCVARQVNWPDTLEAINDALAEIDPDSYGTAPPFLELIEFAMNERVSRGEKVFTGAYVITAPSTKGASKVVHLVDSTLGALWRDRARLEAVFRPGRTMRSAHAELMGYNGWGPFLAYQAVVDMSYCPSLLANATDLCRWAAAGPGTMRGLNRLAGRQIDAPLTQERALAQMLPLFDSIPRETGVTIDLSDVPNVLCEFDKYERVRNGEGTPKARYVEGRGS